MSNILEEFLNNNLSEDCKNDILNMVEELLDEKWGEETGHSAGTDPGRLERRKLAYKDVNMSPDDYIKKASKLTAGKNVRKSKQVQAIEKDRASHTDKIEDYKNKITSKDKEIDKPYLDYSKNYGGQEGLHRAVAAKQAGEKSIPVRIYHSTEKGGNNSKKDNREIRKQIKNDVDRTPKYKPISKTSSNDGNLDPMDFIFRKK